MLPQQAVLQQSAVARPDEGKSKIQRTSALFQCSAWHAVCVNNRQSDKGVILDTQSARNPTIVRLINKFPDPPNKDVGEGLNTAFDAMRSLRLKPPIIEETENTVLVTIRHESLASPEQIVMEYLETNEEINNRTARELTGIKSENSMKNVFLRLKDRGELEQIPDRAGSRAAWRKPLKS